jgi:hypothetical protein
MERFVWTVSIHRSTVLTRCLNTIAATVRAASKKIWPRIVRRIPSLRKRLLEALQRKWVSGKTEVIYSTTTVNVVACDEFGAVAATVTEIIDAPSCRGIMQGEFSDDALTAVDRFGCLE